MPPKAKAKTFTPVPTLRKTKGLYLEVSPELHSRIKMNATKYGVSMKDLSIQALVFAMDHM